MKNLVLSKPRQIISVHNHPHNMLPSSADLVSAGIYKYGVIACHNGTVIKYSVLDNIDLDAADYILNIMQDQLNQKRDLTDSLKLLNLCGVKMEVYQ